MMPIPDTKYKLKFQEIYDLCSKILDRQEYILSEDLGALTPHDRVVCIINDHLNKSLQRKNKEKKEKKRKKKEK